MSGYLREHGRRLIDLGYRIAPVPPGEKYPKGLNNWQAIQADPGVLASWLADPRFRSAGVCIHCHETPAVDIDVYDAEMAERLKDVVREVTGVASLVERIGRAPKSLSIFRTDAPFTKVQTPWFTSPDGQKHKVEILGSGQQFVAYAVHPDTQQPYEWTDPIDEPITLPAAELPLLTHERAVEIVKRSSEIMASAGWTFTAKGTKGGVVQSSDPLENAKPPLDLSIERIMAVIELQDADDHDNWVRVGMALWHQFNGGLTGLELWDEWSRKSDKYEDGKCRERWPSFKPDLSKPPLTMATLVKEHNEQEKIRASNGEQIIGDPYDFAASTADLRLLDIKIEYLVDGLIPTGFVTLFYAPSGMGKSTLANQLCQAVQDGAPFLGLPTIQTHVFYLDFENPLATIVERLRKIGGVKPFPLWHHSCEVPPPKLDGKGSDILFKILPNTLLVIDTLKASNNADENSAKEMLPIMERIKELRRHGMTILLLHHTTKGPDGTYRGSSVIQDQADHCISLAKVRAPGSDQEVADDAEGVVYRLGTRGKTRAKPFKMFLTFDPEKELFVIADDPRAHREQEEVSIIIRAIQQIMLAGGDANQSRIIKEINGDEEAVKFRGAIIPERRIRELLKKGAGVFWEVQPGVKNSQIFRLAFSSAV